MLLPPNATCLDLHQRLPDLHQRLPDLHERLPDPHGRLPEPPVTRAPQSVAIIQIKADSIEPASLLMCG